MNNYTYYNNYAVLVVKIIYILTEYNLRKYNNN